MGFLFLELAIVVVLTLLTFELVHSAPAGGRRAKAVQGKKKADRSEAASEITSGNLEAHYVSFFFEDDALKLIVEIDAFLMKKWTKDQLSPAAVVEMYGKGMARKGGSSVASSSNDGAGSNASSSSGDIEVKKPVVAQKEEDNAYFLAQLHLAELKAILVPKKEKQLDKSELAKKFRKASDEHVLKAKAMMRVLVGSKSMFLELEMRQPLLLRLDLAEPNAALAYFKEILSAARRHNQRTLDSHLRVRIPMLFHYIYESEKMLRGSPANVAAEVSTFWKAEMLPQLEHGISNNDNEDELLVWLATTLENHSIILMKELVEREEEHGKKEIDYMRSWSIAAYKRMALDLFEHDSMHRFRQFIQQTPGARTRFYRLFPESEAFEKYLFYDWSEADYVRRLHFEYINFLTVAAPGHLKSKMSADILVQVLHLEKQFRGNQQDWSEWFGLRDSSLRTVDQMVDRDVDFANSYGSLVKHMLYKRRIHQHQNRGDQWNFASLFDAEIKKSKEFAETGTSEYLVSPEEALAQAEWLNKEHRAMLGRLSLSDEEFKKNMEAIASSPQGKDRMKELLGSDYVSVLQNMQLQEPNGNAIHSQQQPPNEMIAAEKPPKEMPKGKEEATAEEEEAGSSGAGSQM